MPRPELPSAIMLIASGVQTTPQGGLTIIGVNPEVNTWVFPQPLPPLTLVAMVTGGQPGKIYSTRLRAYDHAGKLVGDIAGPDLPFTTQIKRANINYGLQQITAEPIVTKEGTYKFEFVIEEVLATAALEIQRVPQPLPGLPGGQ